MAVYSESIPFRTKGEGDMVDLSDRVASAVQRSGLEHGLACVSTPSSTAAIVANEREPGLLEDLRSLLDRIAPRDADYAHHRAGGERNGRSHVRATLLGPSVTFPVEGGRPVLGAWQQVMFLELDTRGRDRSVRVDIVGE